MRGRYTVSRISAMVSSPTSLRAKTISSRTRQADACRCPAGNFVRTYLASVAGAGEGWVDRPFLQPGHLRVEDVEQVVVGVGDEAAVVVDADRAEVLHDRAEQRQKVLSQ